jgi:hypothetical protein
MSINMSDSMDEDTIKAHQLFKDIDEENEVDDELMNVSSGSTNKEEEMLRFIESSSNTMKNSIDMLSQYILDDSDEDSGRKWGEGSQFGKAQNKPRDFAGAYQRLKINYFNGTASKYNENNFEHRFHMPRSVFNIWEKIKEKGFFVDSKINFSGKKAYILSSIIPRVFGDLHMVIWQTERMKILKIPSQLSTLA